MAMALAMACMRSNIGNTHVCMLLHFRSQDAVAAMEAADNDGEKAMLFAIQAIQAGSCAVEEARKKFITRITDAGFTRRAESLMLCRLPSRQQPRVRTHASVVTQAPVHTYWPRQG